MEKIYYIGNYDIDDNKLENRGFALSARNKMKYICSAINKAGYCVEVVSPAQTANKKSCKGKLLNISKNVELKLFHSLGRKGIVSKIIRRYSMKIQLLWYLLKNMKDGSKVIVYHSLGYMSVIKLLKKFKKIHLIMEVEEVYGDVTGNKKDVLKEYHYFKSADAYIFPTELLDEKINTLNKNSVIIYGTYEVEEIRCKFNDKSLQGSEDGRIHLLYAGTLDPRKGGAIAAAAAAEYLSSNYHIHILGFGSNADIQNMKEYVDKIVKKTEAQVTYDGLMRGEEYIEFVQKCQIGFSTQNPDAAFNDTSFPSKVLSYLSNGLRVVSVRIKALERAEISDLLFYYDEQTPEAIARAVQSIDFSDEYDSRSRIRKLDENFIKKIGEILK